MIIKLMEDSIGDEEKQAVIDCLNSGQYTQWDLVDKFEREFASWHGSKYGVMVNSGSSANLLMVDYLMKKYRLKRGDEVLVPSVTWPTTVFPIIQHGLVPVFCDVDESFNIDVDSMRRMTSDRTKAVFAVHLLGQSADMSSIIDLCAEKDIRVIEDCCESLGAYHKGKMVANFGDMGSFSFYFGHHMTTIEGGMILTNDFEASDWLKSTRSHGWIKRTSRAENYPEHPDKNFVFDTTGYNLRSTELNAAIGLIQLRKIESWLNIRKRNHRHFLDSLSSTGFSSQKVDLDETSSFCLPLLFDSKDKRNIVLKSLYEKKGIETRPIVAGNLLRQPIFSSEHVLIKSDNVPQSEKIHDYGIYLPNNQFVDEGKINYMLKSIGELAGGA